MHPSVPNKRGSKFIYFEKKNLDLFSLESFPPKCKMDFLGFQVYNILKPTNTFIFTQEYASIDKILISKLSLSLISHHEEK